MREGRLQKAMISNSNWVFCGLTVLLCASGPNLHAQTGKTTNQNSCFAIHVRLNRKLVDGPQVITLRTKQSESTASLEAGCFRVPTALLTEKAVDVIFTLPGNKIHLVAISPSFFTCPWDIDLEDKKFNRDVGLPKHARIREACVVVFHAGEPENELSQTGCRAPISP
jgi:hypothetical protein